MPNQYNPDGTHQSFTGGVVNDTDQSRVMNNPINSSGIINNSYQSERSQKSLIPMNAMLQQPGTQQYRQWKNEFENKMQGRDERNAHPIINERSKQMIESKRVNTSSGSKVGGSIHDRLHK